MARTADTALGDVLFFAGKRAPTTDRIPSHTVSAGTLPVQSGFYWEGISFDGSWCAWLLQPDSQAGTDPERGTKPVGAGLLANPVNQRYRRRLTRRVRQQAGSYGMEFHPTNGEVLANGPYSRHSSGGCSIFAGKRAPRIDRVSSIARSLAERCRCRSGSYQEGISFD